MIDYKNDQELVVALDKIWLTAIKVCMEVCNELVSQVSHGAVVPTSNEYDWGFCFEKMGCEKAISLTIDCFYFHMELNFCLY
jgi:hypothetical protein